MRPGLLEGHPDPWTHVKLAAIAEQDEQLQVGGGEVTRTRADPVIHSTPNGSPCGFLKTCGRS